MPCPPEKLNPYYQQFSQVVGAGTGMWGVMDHRVDGLRKETKKVVQAAASRKMTVSDHFLSVEAQIWLV